MRKTKKIMAALLTAAMVIGSLTGCGGGNSATSTNDKGEIAELINAVQPESGEYDPAGAAAYEYFSVQTNCYEGFVSYDKEGKIVPAAADHWDVNDDATEYTFYIRDDEKWSDGSDVTSADFENTMKRALEPDNGSWYVDFLFVIKNAEKCFNGKCDFKDVGIECIDDKTIKFILEEPCSYFLDLCKLPTYMPSNCKYATDDNKDWDMNPEQNLGNGPYHLSEHVDGDHVSFEKNKYYRDAKSTNVLKITDKFMDDDQAKASAYQTGEINILQGAPSEIAESYEGKGLPTITYTYPAMSYEANVAQVLQAQWKKLGVDVKLEAMEYEVYVDERRNGKLQMARMQWYADYNDPTSWLKMYQTGNAQNDVKWSNAKYDKLIQESDKNLDEASRQKQLMEAEKILVSEDTVICPLFSPSNQDLIDPSLTGYYTDGLAYTFFYKTKKK